MGFIWPSKNDDQSVNSRTSRNHLDTDHAEENERTQLLRPSSQSNYLSPDDPAVTPYNLWRVRYLRYLSFIFTILTFFWWILLFIAIFVTPPGMIYRGSGFYGFAFTTLALSLLLAILLFFSTPSKAAQITSLIMSTMLLFDMIMIVAVPKIRTEEGWAGLASVIWALMMSIWTICTNYIVTGGKYEEEERLTGRSETRRSLVEWFGVFTSTVVLNIMAVAVLLLSCNLILRSRDSSLHSPGERYFVDGNKYKVHLFCSANENSIESSGYRPPTVLFEAGEDTFEESMIQIATNSFANGSISRYCYWDRPGFGWSDNAPSPFSAGNSADILYEALVRAGEEESLILVSAGIGSIYSRVFSARHGDRIRGLLMIDPLHEDLLHRVGSPIRGFKLWARGVLSPLGLDRVPAAILRGRSREDRIYGRSAYQGGKYIKAKLQESLTAESTTRSEVISARSLQNESVPLVLISSGIQMKHDTEWETKQRDLSLVTKNLVGWDIVDAPSKVWNTIEGRNVIERRLKDLLRFDNKDII
ncbi:mitochondrial integral membrane protein [Blumeria hordei DH14]|uniref:Mitochondrial integral membrane protein n=1 Tax=Blumeria graminis f. sp. hordei (strain DH14) TaxID=546991 RepID=N1JEC6_BLUG1|nr:mitochondrial integral membrane protein [Blumeria hordei DH14]